MREFTSDQKRAIDKTEKSLLVSAAAGSGKTTVLVERVCSILSDEKDRVSPDEILVVTFTRPAAAEMKERISVRLRELAEQSGSRYLKKQQMLLVNSNISTIDSFCQNLVREYFYLSDIDRDFKFLSDADKTELCDRAMAYTVEELYKKHGQGAVDFFGALGNEQTACKEIKNLYNFIYAKPFPYDFLDEAISKYETDSVSGNFYLNKLDEKDREKTAEILPVLKEKIAIFTEAVKCYGEELARLKKEKNQYDFSDIEHSALRLLCEKTDDGEKITEVAKSISNKLSYVLVDEYQDTNELQDKIFRTLSKDGKNLFVVGDSKQSIYGFRQANPEIFINLKNDDRSKKVNLSANFRSRKSVCNSVNEIFDSFADDVCGGINYKEERLIAKAKYEESDSDKTEFWIVDRGDNKEGVPIVEAQLISKWINEKIAEGYEIYDLKIGAKRPMKYGDVAVLLRNVKDKGEKYKDTFVKNKIPASFTAGENPFVGIETEILLDLLRSINNPLHDIHLFSALMSPFFSLTADDIVKIKKEGKDLYSSLIISAEEGDEKAKPAQRRLADFKAKANALPLNLFIEEIYLSTGYYAVVGGMSEGRRRQKNLCRLVAAAEDYCKSTDGAIGGFIRYVENLKESSIGKGEISNDNVVNIISGHKSKGLEFPICFIAGTNYKIKPGKIKKYADLVMHPKSGIGMLTYDPKLNVRYLNEPYNIIANDILKDTVAEELRLLYVQMTRAKNKLIMIYSERVGSDIFKGLSQVDEAIEGLGEAPSLDYSFISNCQTMGKIIYSAIKLNGKNTVCKTKAAVAISEEENLNEVFPADLEKVKSLRNRFLREENVKNKNIPAKITASEINRKNHGAEYNFKATPAFMSDKKLSAADIGTALHTFMQYCDFERAGENPRAELERLFERGFIGEEEKSVIEDSKITEFFNSELYKRIENSGRVYREKQFTVLLRENEIYTDGSDEEIVVQGICDLAFEEDGGLTVIDYKTDSCNCASELFERYRNQLNIYAKCLQKATGVKVKRTGIYSFSKSEVYEEKL